MQWNTTLQQKDGVIDTSITMYRFQKSDAEGTQLDAKGNILSDSIYMKFYYKMILW